MRDSESALHPGPGGQALVALLRRARRRLLLSGMLAGAFGAALLNEAVRWGAIGVNHWAGRRLLPILEAGPVFLALLPVLLLRRWSLEAVALSLDARLGLRERLTSFLDFSGRADVPDDLRRAQAEETARTLARVGIDAALPLRPWLAAGPALLLLSLLYPLFQAVGPETPLVQLVRLIAPDTTPGGGRAGRRQGADNPAAQPPQARPGARRDAGEHGSRADRATAPSDRRPPEATRDAATKNDAGEQAREARNGPKPPPREPTQDGSPKQPEAIESERVGTALAQVVSPLFNPGRAVSAPAPEPAPAGSFSYQLLPKSGRGGTGGARGAVETADPERVTVDFNALPEQYRSLVRAYFTLLARNAATPAHDNPVPTEKP